MGSSRSSKKAGKTPAPLLSSDASRRHDSFGSDLSYSNEWSPGSQRQDSSYSHQDRAAPSRKSSSSSTKSIKPSSPTVNRHSHCGRHSDQWLLGGFSMTDAIKSAWKKE